MSEPERRAALLADVSKIDTVDMVNATATSVLLLQNALIAYAQPDAPPTIDVPDGEIPLAGDVIDDLRAKLAAERESNAQLNADLGIWQSRATKAEAALATTKDKLAFQLSNVRTAAETESSLRRDIERLQKQLTDGVNLSMVEREANFLREKLAKVEAALAAERERGDTLARQVKNSTTDWKMCDTAIHVLNDAVAFYREAKPKDEAVTTTEPLARICDRCKATIFHGGSDDLISHGWKITDTGWRCPKCSNPQPSAPPEPAKETYHLHNGDAGVMVMNQDNECVCKFYGDGERSHWLGMLLENGDEMVALLEEVLVLIGRSVINGGSTQERIKSLLAKVKGETP